MHWILWNFEAWNFSKFTKKENGTENTFFNSGKSWNFEECIFFSFSSNHKLNHTFSECMRNVETKMYSLKVFRSKAISKRTFFYILWPARTELPLSFKRKTWNFENVRETLQFAKKLFSQYPDCNGIHFLFWWCMVLYKQKHILAIMGIYVVLNK